MSDWASSFLGLAPRAIRGIKNTWKKQQNGTLKDELKTLWEGDPSKALSVPTPYEKDELEDFIKQYNKLADASERQKSANTFLGDTQNYSLFKKYTNDCKDLVTNVDDLSEAYKKAAVEAQNFNQKSVAVTGLKSTLAGLAKGIGSMGLNIVAGLALDWAMGAISTGIDEIIHKEEKIIEKGENARKVVEDLSSQFETKKTSVFSLAFDVADEKEISTFDDSLDTIAERYVELKQGVLGSNQNFTLSNQEYQEYLDISNQLAGILPSLITGTDNYGNYIISLGDNASEAADKLKTLMDNQMAVVKQQAQEAMPDIAEESLLKAQKDKDKLTEQKAELKGLKEIQDRINTNTGYDEANKIWKVSDSIVDAKGVQKMVDLDWDVEDALYDAGIDFEYDYGDGYTAFKILGDWEKAKEIIDAFATAAFDGLGQQIYDLEDGISVTKDAIKTDLAPIIDNFKSQLQNDRTISELPEVIQNALLNAVNDVDIEELSEEMDPDQFNEFLYSSFIAPFKNIPDDQKDQILKSLADVLDFSGAKSKYNLYEHDAKALDTLKALSSDYSYLYGALGLFDFNLENQDKRIRLVDMFPEQQDAIDAFKMEDLDIAFDLVANDQFSGTFDDLMDRITEIKDATPKGEFDTFEQMLGDTSETGLSSIIDDFQSKMDTIKSAFDSLSSGELNEVDLKQQFPELTEGVDNLEHSLSSLSASSLQKFVSDYRSAMDKLSADEKPQAESFLQTILDSIELDLSKLSSIDFKSMVLSNISKNGSSGSGSSPLGEWTKIIDEVENIPDEVLRNQAREIILKLSADPEKAYSAYEELRGILEENPIELQLRANKKSIENVQHILQNTQKSLDDEQYSIDLKKARGQKLTSDDYVRMIDASKADVAARQRNIGLLYEQINLRGLTESDEEYWNIHSEINSITASIRSATLEQIEWNNTLNSLPIANMQAFSSALDSALSEIQSATGLTSETINSIKTQFSSLENMDASNLFYQTADGIKVDVVALKDFAEAEDEVIRSQFASQIEAQRKAIESYQKQLGDNVTNNNLRGMQDNLESLMNRQAQYFAEYQKQMSKLNEYENIQRAKNTENGGAHYDSMLSDLKSAKEMYDKGLVGTDDFKSIAAYFDSYGFDDADSFIGNYEKASKYLTEDSSGILAFLNDLEDHGYASFETLDDGTEQWVTTIRNAEEAARSLGIGVQFFKDMFGKTEDYGAINNIVNSMEESELRTRDLNRQLAEARIKYSELKAEGADDSALQKQQEVIDGIQQSLVDTQTATNEYIQNAKDEYASGFVNAKEQMGDLRSWWEEAKASGDYNSERLYEQEMKDLADKYHLTLTSAFEIDEESYQQKWNELFPGNKGTISSPISPDFRDDTQSAENYATVLGKVQEAYANNDSTLQDALSTLSKYNAEELKSIQLNDGQYDSDGLKDAEMALDALAAQFGLTEEQAQMLAVVMESIGAIKVEPQVDDSEITGGIEKLQELQEAGEITSEIDLSANITEMSSDELQDRLGTLEEIKVKLDPETAEYDAVCQLIENTELQAKIQTVLDDGNTATELLKLGDSEIQKVIKCDASEVDAVKATLTSIAEGETVPVTVKIDESQMSQITGSKTVDVETDTANQKIEVVTEKLKQIPDSKPIVAIKDYASTVIDKIKSSLNQLNGKEVISTIKVNRINQTQNVSTPAPMATGTAVLDKWTDYRHSMGAYAGGTSEDWTLKTNETALVNELGNESIVRDGKWFMLPGGAHVENLRKGDIVFNHQQTEELVKYGKVISGGGHGQIAFADGTASSGMPAHANVNRLNLKGGASSNSKKNKTNSKNNTGKNNSSKNKTKNKNAGKSLDKILTELDKLFDWIEVRIQRREERIDLYTTRAENETTYQKKNAQISKAQTETTKLIEDQTRAVAEYQAQANRTAKEVKLSADLKKKVDEGKINIQSLSENDKKRVEAYKQWVDKAKECEQAIEDLNQQQKELAQTKLDNIMDQYDSIISLAEAAQNASKALVDYYTSAGNVVNSNDAKAQFNSQMAQQNLITSNLQSQRDAYATELSNAAIVFGVDSNEYREAAAALSELEQSLYESKSAYNELNKQLFELDLTRIQYVINNLEAVGDKMKDIVSLREKTGSTINESDYANQIANNNQIIEQYYKDWQSRQQKIAVEGWMPGSENYQEYYEAIMKDEQAIYSLVEGNEDLKASIVNLRWKPFDTLQTKLKQSIEDFDYIRDLLNEEGFFDDDANLTPQGYANIALLGEAMTKAKQQVSDYSTALNKLEQEYQNGNITLDSYNERSREYIDAIKDSISSIEDYKDALIEMYKTQITAENDALQESIDKRKEALQKKKEYYDYDKQLKSKNKDVNTLMAQVAALEGVNNQQSRAELERLKAQLADAQEERNELVKDHAYEVKISGYENLANDANEALEDTLKALETNSQKQQEVVNMMLESIKSNYSSAYSEIQSIISSTGLKIGSEAQTAINALGNLKNALDMVNAAQAQQSTIPSSSQANSINTSTIQTSSSSTNAIVNAISGDTAANIAQQTSIENAKKAEADRIRQEQEAVARAQAAEAERQRQEAETERQRQLAAAQAEQDRLDKLAKAKAVIKKMKKSNVKKNSKEYKDHLPLWKYVYGKTGKHMSNAGQLELGKVLGVSGLPKSGDKLTASKKAEILAALKAVGYKKGAKSIQNPGKYWTHEGEIIVRKSDGAILRPLGVGDSVIPQNLSENLFKWGAISPDTFKMNNMIYPEIARRDMSVTNHYDSLLTVYGDVDKTVLPELKEILQKSYEYTSKQLRKEANKLGIK